MQAIKACGVTFAVSLLERVIEEQAGGDAQRADALRQEILADIGSNLASIKPGSPAALKLKEDLIRRGAWSQYMEVGIGPYAEVFSKSQPMSAVGLGAQVGLHPESKWNNPEPEIVLAVNGRREVVGATLGNDVNLRDIEGRSALLLGKAKDNNGSCAIGPFIRLFDGEHFTIDTVREAEVRLLIEGRDDDFRLDGVYALYPSLAHEHVLFLDAELGEGPVGHGAEAALYFADIKGRRIHRCKADGSERRSWPAPAAVDFDAITQ